MCAQIQIEWEQQKRQQLYDGRWEICAGRCERDTIHWIDTTLCLTQPFIANCAEQENKSNVQKTSFNTHFFHLLYLTQSILMNKTVARIDFPLNRRRFTSGGKKWRPYFVYIFISNHFFSRALPPHNKKDTLLFRIANMVTKSESFFFSSASPVTGIHH